MLQAASFACYPERVRVKGEERVSPELAVGGKMDPNERAIGTRDEHYGLISVLYHALHGVETAEVYAVDAEAPRGAGGARGGGRTSEGVARHPRGCAGGGKIFCGDRIGWRRDTYGGGTTTDGPVGVRDPATRTEASVPCRGLAPW
jgi:hypothetical protein